MKANRIFMIIAIILFVNGCTRSGVTRNEASANAPKGKKTRQTGTSVGMKAPDFTLKDISGKEFKLSKNAGKRPVLINFWATWCVVCKEEMPLLNSMYKEFKEKDIVFVAVNYQDTDKKIKRFLKTTPVNFPVLLDPKGKVTEGLYGASGLPVTILVDREGTVVYNASEPPDKSKLSKLLAAATPEKSDRQPKGKANMDKYGLATGQTAPDFTVKTDAGDIFSLRGSLKKGPAVLVFYRGGWCPFCQMQIRELQKNAVEFKKRGATLAALSVDQVVYASETSEKEKLGFPLLSDPDAEVLEKYRLLFHVDDATMDKYTKYGLDLEKASGRSHHTIAVPAVFVIDSKGIIRWAYVNEDYKVRAKIAGMLKALDDIRK